MHKIRWGCARDPAGRAYSAPPDPLAVFKGDYFYRGRRGKRAEKREGKGRGG